MKIKNIILSSVAILTLNFLVIDVHALTNNEKYILENQGSQEDIELNNANLQKKNIIIFKK